MPLSIDPVSLAPLPFTVGLAFLTVAALEKFFPVPIKPNRASTIDGLRGYLAFGVFLHHACIWYFFLRTGTWKEPPSRIYTHLGETSVSLFFMITGYLFFKKILESKEFGLDWLRLYISRGLRILPALAFLLLISAATIGAIRHFNLDLSNPSIIPNTARKLYLTAGVTWTLKYEWHFYFTLPMLALLIWRRPPWILAILSAAYISLQDFSEIASIYSTAFLGGILAAHVSHKEWLSGWARTQTASTAAIFLILAVVVGFDSAYAPLPMTLLSAAFVLIANGADVFGILSNRLSRVFGEITYSLYLLHGFVLFIGFRFLVGLSKAAALSPLQHWLIVCAITPVVITVAFFSYRAIEAPAIQQTERLTFWLRARLQSVRRHIVKPDQR